MNWLDYKFHPASLGKIMTEARSKNDGLGETCLKHLLECWIEQRYGRKKDVTNKYIEKGRANEEDSLTLYSRVTKTFYVKNKETIQNDFFIGTPDIIQPGEVIDVKSSWDIFTFYANLLTSTKKAYYWQLQAYMDLTDKPTSKLVYCLTDTPEVMIVDAKRRLSWQMGVSDENVNQEYIDACANIDKLMTYGDIDIRERYIEIKIDRDQEAIDRAHKRVQECREFLNSLSVNA